MDEDDEHHTDPCHWSALGMGMVTQFPLDYMHLACLGVMRKLINLWKSGFGATRLGPTQIGTISQSLDTLKAVVPKEFACKPRSLWDVDRWKATEFR